LGEKRGLFPKKKRRVGKSPVRRQSPGLGREGTDRVPSGKGVEKEPRHQRERERVLPAGRESYPLFCGLEDYREKPPQGESEMGRGKSLHPL